MTYLDQTDQKWTRGNMKALTFILLCATATLAQERYYQNLNNNPHHGSPQGSQYRDASRVRQIQHLVSLGLKRRGYNPYRGGAAYRRHPVGYPAQAPHSNRYRQNRYDVTHDQVLRPYAARSTLDTVLAARKIHPGSGSQHSNHVYHPTHNNKVYQPTHNAYQPLPNKQVYNPYHKPHNTPYTHPYPQRYSPGSNYARHPTSHLDILLAARNNRRHVYSPVGHPVHQSHAYKPVYVQPRYGQQQHQRYRDPRTSHLGILLVARQQQLAHARKRPIYVQPRYSEASRDQPKPLPSHRDILLAQRSYGKAPKKPTYVQPLYRDSKVDVYPGEHQKKHDLHQYPDDSTSKKEDVYSGPLPKSNKCFKDYMTDLGSYGYGFDKAGYPSAEIDKEMIGQPSLYDQVSGSSPRPTHYLPDPRGLCQGEAKPLRRFNHAGGICHVVIPDKQTVTAHMCKSRDFRYGGASSGVNKCVENTEDVLVWAYCGHLTTPSKIVRVSVRLPVGCGPKNYSC